MAAVHTWQQDVHGSKHPQIKSACYFLFFFTFLMRLEVTQQKMCRCPNTFWLHCTHTHTHTQAHKWCDWISNPGVRMLVPAQASVHVAEHCHTAATHSLVHYPGDFTPLRPLTHPQGELWQPPWGRMNLPVSLLLGKKTCGGKEGGTDGWVDEHKISERDGNR